MPPLAWSCNNLRYIAGHFLNFLFYFLFLFLKDNQMFTDTITKCAANAARIARLSANNPLGFGSAPPWRARMWVLGSS